MSPGLWADGGPYHAWAAFLEPWACGANVDPTGLPMLAPADFPVDTWERLQARIVDALSNRLQSWANAMTAALGIAADDFSYGRVLGQSRAGLATIRSLAAHPSLPEDLRSRLITMVDDQIQDLQTQLEQSLDHLKSTGTDPRHIESRRRSLRDNPLTAQPPPTEAWTHNPTTPTRRIIRPQT
ncbi:hypothetical protein [Embleya sp. NBC_00896]|uniref:hypothetical protein n=1 Tax=Embleya sp. NBC_00896 TaxID=2975961 RepID=UPI0038645845|nr:hypothetical protein OG928_04690 [Embleya sp. NBC_00896]